MSYGEVQDVLDGKPLSAAVLQDFEAVDVEHDLKILNDLARKLRHKRHQSGCLGLESIHLSFSLDENGLPTDTSNYERTDSHKLIEEVRPEPLIAPTKH